MYLTEIKSQGPPYPYIPKKTAARSSKGKGRQLRDDEFEREREWVLSMEKQIASKEDAVIAEKLNEQEYEECGDGIECGCCFSSHPFVSLRILSTCFSASERCTRIRWFNVKTLIYSALLA